MWQSAPSPRRSARGMPAPRKVDIRLPGKRNSNSHGARPVHQKHRWIRTSRLSIKNSLYARAGPLIPPCSERDCVKSLRSSILHGDVSPEHPHFGLAFMSEIPIVPLEKPRVSVYLSLLLSRSLAGCGGSLAQVLGSGCTAPLQEHRFDSPQHPAVSLTVATYRNLVRS